MQARRQQLVAWAASAVLAGLIGSAEGAIQVTSVTLPFGSAFSDAGGYAISGTSVAGYALSNMDGNRHAVSWSNGTIADLNPSGFQDSVATGVWQNQRVGYGYDPLWNCHALLWAGTGSTPTDLTPALSDSAQALAVYNGQQVGMASIVDNSGAPNDHAVLWQGTAKSMVDLHPSTFIRSQANAIYGTQQVGYGQLLLDPTNVVDHALLWTGTAASVVDLHPTGFENTYATGTDGTRQVGYGTPVGGNQHALMWNGSADSVVDLNPSGFVESQALAMIAAGMTVGWGTVDNADHPQHALLWAGGTNVALDLNQSGGYASSAAYGIDVVDAALGIYKVVGEATDDSGSTFPVVWTVSGVPEPAALSLLALAPVLGLWQRRGGREAR